MELSHSCAMEQLSTSFSTRLYSGRVGTMTSIPCCHSSARDWQKESTLEHRLGRIGTERRISRRSWGSHFNIIQRFCIHCIFVCLVTWYRA
ncbi:hypothetical protein BT67DRAFT_315372 [Trichocladium antarcticum]|uniref:Uncharacterized protein n=1 Tax=Trichocladium antarcticum TaxID=1450529 RepID=A0AAN6UKE9_9PEZI|nr:hypothetical protein BT67DRAFT_315372 [Trichocladium antarcticum]